MIFDVSPEIYVDEIRAADRARYVELLADRRIYQTTLNIPYPYKGEDADWYIEHVAEQKRRLGRPLEFCVRTRAEKGPGGGDLLIGGCGFVHGDDITLSHRAEIGYWIGVPYWNRGIMSEVVGKLCEYGFSEFPSLVKLTAHVFAGNIGSARVLEKNGFIREGVLRSHYKKDGVIRDGWLYARLRD